MKSKYLFLAGFMAVIAAAGFFLLRGKGDSSAGKRGERLQISASFYPVYLGVLDITQGSGNLEISNLTQNAGGCLHDYQLTTENMVKLGNSDLFIINGGGMEPFIAEAAKQYPGLKIVDTGEGLWEEEENPHIWLYPEYYKLQLKSIADALSEISPEQSAVFQSNLDRSGKKLDELMEKGKKLEEAFQGKPAILLHEGFEYLADLTGLDSKAVMDLDEESQLSASEISELVTLARENPDLVVLYDEEYGKDTAELIRRESGVRILILDPITSGNGSPEEYYRAMNENLEKLEKEFLP